MSWRSNSRQLLTKPEQLRCRSNVSQAQSQPHALAGPVSGLHRRLHACASAAARRRDIQRHFGLTPPSVHHMILTLERAGLIRRSQHRGPRLPRGSARLASPHPTGQDLCAEVLAHFAAVEEIFTPCRNRPHIRACQAVATIVSMSEYRGSNPMRSCAREASATRTGGSPGRRPA
jgi:DNA-binding MarR family transcriptional regulator